MRTIKQIQEEYKKKVEKERNIKKRSESKRENLLKEKANTLEVDNTINLEEDHETEIKTGLNLTKPNKIQKKVHFEDKKTPTTTEINEVINLKKG